MNLQKPLSLLAVLALILAYAAVPAVAAEATLGVEVGDVFDYDTVAVGDEVKAPAASFASARGQSMVIPLPKRQTARVLEKKACGESTCLLLEVEQFLPPFIPQLSDKDFIKKVRGLVNVETGNVSEVKSTMVMGGSVSESTQDDYLRDSTLGEFFGPWMLDLKDGYTTSSERLGGEVRSFRVTGREPVDGHECFVVERKREMPSGDKVEARLWIDVERRVMLRIEQDKQTMEWKTDG